METALECTWTACSSWCHENSGCLDLLTIRPHHYSHWPLTWMDERIYTERERKDGKGQRGMNRSGQIIMWRDTVGLCTVVLSQPVMDGLFDNQLLHCWYFYDVYHNLVHFVDRTIIKNHENQSLSLIWNLFRNQYLLSNCGLPDVCLNLKAIRIFFSCYDARQISMFSGQTQF